MEDRKPEIIRRGINGHIAKPECVKPEDGDSRDAPACIDGTACIGAGYAI